MKSKHLKWFVIMAGVCCFAGYGARQSFVNLFGTPTNRGVVKEICIANRGDGLPGTGSIEDPYNTSTDGSTTPNGGGNFDYLLNNITIFTTNITINFLGNGPFKTNPVLRTWSVRNGWHIKGSGQGVTTCMIDSATNMSGQNYEVSIFASPYNTSVDNVTIEDMDFNCNYTGIQASGDTTNGEKNFKTAAISLYGSHNLVRRVHAYDSYGSQPSANNQEQFTIALVCQQGQECSDNVIDSCCVDRPQGTYGAPYAMFGGQSFPIKWQKSSRITNCYAKGIENGGAPGYTTGGINVANVKDCSFTDNTFEDCGWMVYQDTGPSDTILTARNVGRRMSGGVAFQQNASSDSGSWTKKNLSIINNKVSIQNRITGQKTGIIITGSATTNSNIVSNEVDYDTTTGSGDGTGYWNYYFQGLDSCNISFNKGRDDFNSLNETLTPTTNTFYFNRTWNGKALPWIDAANRTDLADTERFPVTLHSKILTVLTTGTPLDVGTIKVPPNITRYTVVSLAAGPAPLGYSVAETAAGTLAGASFTIRDAATGGGNAITNAFVGPTASGIAVRITSITGFTTVLTSPTLYINQTANSANAGTESFFITILPLP